MEMIVKSNDGPWRAAMVRIGHSLFARGLAAGASGNMSLRMDNGAYLMTPTGSSLGELTEDSLSVLSAEGQHLSGPKPTKEAHMHLAGYAARPSAGAVIHLHSPYATAYSCLMGLNPQDAIATITPYGLMRYGRVALAPYRTPGSPLLAQDMLDLMESHQAVLLSNHGSVVTGKDIASASYNVEELEESCRLYFILAKHPINNLNAEQQETLLRKTS
jgi:3-dehydro-4-phosphotetronate decarboxylase